LRALKSADYPLPTIHGAKLTVQHSFVGAHRDRCV